MERQETLERKLSKRKSNSGTSPKSVKRSATTAHPSPLPAQNPCPPNTDGDHSDERRRGEAVRETERHEASQMNSPRSIIPDSKDLPASLSKDSWSQVPLPTFKLRYAIHNPIGPRWYKNHHLVAPSETSAAARPPSFFSPSFPPIASSASQHRSEDATLLNGPSRTSSASPLPTPNSSQTRVVDKPRSRKTSQTAHDNVDLLDSTDPWGTNWHHHSPYDVGLSNGPISVDVQDTLHTRTRRSSLSTPSRRTIIPSPLSQSTSAVHLPRPPDTGAHIPRKLSKRRTPTVANIFGGRSKDTGRNATSLPTTPMERQPPPTELPKRMSVALPNEPTMFPSSGSSPKKEKRGSVLGRLVKKFSLLKKQASGREDEWHHVASDQPMVDTAPAPRNDYFLPERQLFPEKRPSDLVKRVPPPSADESPHPVTPDEPIKGIERSSFISLETPFSIGRLTVANPDTPGSGEVTPAHGDIPLPPQKFELTDPRVSADMYRSPSPSAYRPGVSISPDIPDKSSPPTPPPETERAPEMSPMSSPGSLRPSLDQQRPSFAQNNSSSSVRPAPSVMRRTSRISVKDTQSRGSYAADKATVSSYRTGSSSNTTQQAEPVSRESETPGPPPPQKMRPASVASSVPFPAAEAKDRATSWHMYDNSPLSAASMIANPPTPYSKDTILATPQEAPPALPRPTTDNVSASQMTRQTETFRLVRSPSGNVYASNETFIAGGQQWEVVEATDKGKSKASSSFKDRSSRDRDSKAQDKDLRHHKDRDSKDRSSKDREYDSKGRDSSRREKKRESKTKAEPEPEAESSRRRPRSHREKADRVTSTSKPTAGTDDSDHRHRELISATVQQDGERDKDARRREDRERRRSERKKREAAVNAEKARAASSAPTPDPPYTRPIGRHPSLSARPTSQLPSADEMNAIKAKEAWEMERLWKARSMQGEELNRYQTIPSNQHTPTIGSISDGDSQSALYGSSHTAFVVSTPFQSQHSIYHSMPSAAPPIIYSSPSSIPTVVHQLPPTHQKSHSRLYSDSIASDVASYTSSTRTPHPPTRSTNPPTRSTDPPFHKLIPLPDPPRESSYEIPADTRNSEYWTKYAGLTASH